MERDGAEEIIRGGSRQPRVGGKEQHALWPPRRLGRNTIHIRDSSHRGGSPGQQDDYWAS